MGNRESSSSGSDSLGSNGNQNTQDENMNDMEEANPSTWQMIKMGYQELVNAIIRPPRARYTVLDLGPPEFNFCGKDFQRVDFELHNLRNQVIQCSLWEAKPRPTEPVPCVIYMHGNSSCRAEALPQLSLVLSLGACLLAFDFAGSGLSEGDYVSLGYYEKDDLACVIEYLRGTARISTIALWGRSMGAATALLHGERDPSIAAMVLDSAFSDLQRLAEEMVDKGRQHGYSVPQWIVRLAIRFIRSSVQKAAGFDIRELAPIAKADRCFIPGLFVAAKNDDFVPCSHSQDIYGRYAGDKNLIIVDGDHNSTRPRFMFDSVGIFLMTTLQLSAAATLDDSSQSYGQPPWISSYGVDMMGLGEDDLPFELLQNIGMTDERQQEVQAALLSMLGDRRAGQSMQANLSNQIQDDMVLRRSNPNATEWACTVCTLINLPHATRCRECLTLREDDDDLITDFQQEESNDATPAAARTTNDDHSAEVTNEVLANTAPHAEQGCSSADDETTQQQR